MKIMINQLGYLPNMMKTAVITGGRPEQLLVKRGAETVLTMPVTGPAQEIWGDETVQADFSCLTEEGEYTLQCGACESAPFRVAADPYAACLTALTDLFYYQRCGCEVDARAGVHAHPACHTQPARIYGTQARIDVSGGWHDAGDYGRYVVPAAKAVMDLLLALTRRAEAFAEPGLTDLREELRWELAWLLKMQRQDGGVYHKVSCARFCGMIMPHEEQEELIVSPVSTTATGDFAACMAMAAAFFAAEDPAFAAQVGQAARQAWDFLNRSEPILFRNPEGIRTGGYGDGSDADERLLAHVALWRLTGEDVFLQAAERALGETDRSDAPLGWADMRGYAAMAGLALPGVLGETCRTWILEAAAQKLAQINTYGITMTDRLPWGSCMNVANDGMLFHQAWQLTGDARYLAAAEKQLHYLLGVNPMSVCYVTGFGANPVRRPHHRPSVATGVCVPGMLSGGAASGMMDACARERLQGQPAGKCFVDEHASYSTNEICIYWNSPLVALLAALDR